MPGLEVRQAERSDWPQIYRFIESNYGSQARYKDWPRHQWQFLDNPHRSEAQGFPIWIAVTGTDRVVGAIAVQPATLWLGGDLFPAGWIVDVMIDPEYRGRGLGHKLHSALQPTNPILVTLTMALATRKMAEKAGAITLGEGFQYTRLGNPTPKQIQLYLKERARRKAWAANLVETGRRLGAPYVLTPFAKAIGSRIGPKADLEIDIQPVDRFGRVADELWEAVKTDYPAIFVRDSKHMDWRFGTPPDLSYERFVARRKGKAVGMLVLRRSVESELPIGFISDIFAGKDDEPVWRSLMNYAVTSLRKDRAFIEGAASMGILRKQFQAFGFLPTHKVRATVVAADARVRETVERCKNEWFFTKGDHDWDQVHPIGHT
ncbi:hypothetical protein F183_A54610 (plasmid) [Bryobacterales bacterium F-183]|nr:hypothetical protein F183_A54610 [Bryobacterales bacterium F-183]